jgi:hypothetical protein
VLKAHDRELEIRAIIAWESLVRAHKSLGVDLGCDVANEFKTILRGKINAFNTDLSISLQNCLKRLSTQVPMSLAGAKEHLVKKHDIEVDLYADSLRTSGADEQAIPSQYNFYGSVGAVQTGANSQANVVQHISASDQTALLQALGLARDAIRSSNQFGGRQQSELLGIVDDCEFELGSSSPNNTKLLSMFVVLATAIQAVASAQPAYHALKVALLPLGVTLP